MEFCDAPLKGLQNSIQKAGTAQARFNLVTSHVVLLYWKIMPVFRYV